MRQYEMYELKFAGPEPEASFVEVDFTTVFSCGGEKKKVDGFYAGNGVYKVRFLPMTPGHYTWQTSGVITASGEADCEAAAEGCHGMVQAVGTHFAYQDGTRYLPFGTTIYALAHQDEELIEETFASLAKAPFNKVRHCVFPKHYLYNANDPQYFAFEKDADGKWDVHHPCMAFWDHFEQILCRLGAMGIETDLILFHSYDRWGFSLMSVEEWKVYLDYLLRRLSAYPFLWWSMANEYDFVFSKTMDDWYAIEEFIHAHDPYGHLLGNHNGVRLYDHARPNITHASIQTSGVFKCAEWIKRYKKPVMIDECRYEGNIEMPWGNITGFELVNRFWCAVSVGAFATHGETFLDENDVLWWAKGGRLKGESAPRIAFLKDILYGLSGYLEPWEEPFCMDPTEINLTTTLFEDSGLPFGMVMASRNEEELAISEPYETNYTGRIGDEVFVKYYSRQCPAKGGIILPEDGTYRVDAVDVWEMTRVTVAERVSGNVTVTLPGKEGMALIAVKIKA